MNTRLLIPLVALAFTPVAAQAKTSSPAPEATGSDCSWIESGQTITVGGSTYTCHCAQLTGPNGPEVLCRWMNKDKLPARKRKPAKRTVARVRLVVRAVPHA